MHQIIRHGDMVKPALSRTTPIIYRDGYKVPENSTGIVTVENGDYKVEWKNSDKKYDMFLYHVEKAEDKPEPESPPPKRTRYACFDTPRGNTTSLPDNTPVRPPNSRQNFSGICYDIYPAPSA